jgi:hypothetical protein
MLSSKPGKPSKKRSSIWDRVKRFLFRKASNSSAPKNSPPQKREFVPSKKRVYLRQGILESNQDYAERAIRAMKEAGILPPNHPVDKLPPTQH